MSILHSIPRSTRVRQRSLTRRPIAAALALAFSFGTANAALITVDSASDGTVAGSCTLRDAVAAANTDAAVAGCVAGSGADVIHFANGIDAIRLTSAAGGMLTATESVTIDGEGSIRTISRSADDDAFRILRAMKGASLTLHWLKISGGLADADVPERGGAGVLAWSALSITNSEISGNLTSPQYGRGGGINAHDTLELVDSIVTGNATTGQDASGGGLYTYGNATLIASTVSDNVTAGFAAFGGGIASYPGVVLDLSNASVTRNSTIGDASYGGGIFAGLSEVSLTNSTVSANSTTGESASGGGGYAYTLTAVGSSVAGNSTAGYGSVGGGFTTGSATITNCTISDNLTLGENANGAGLVVFSSLEANNSTLTANTAARGDGGGVFAFSFDAIPITLNSSIVYGNPATTSEIASIAPDTMLTVEGDHNLVGAVAPNIQLPKDTLACDPLLQPLGDNGGSTQTRALGSGSCAIDAGSASVALSFDQRGEPFVRNFGEGPDIGSLETQPLQDDIFSSGFEG